MRKSNDNSIQYHVSREVHKALIDLFSRLDLDTAEHLLGIPRSGVRYTDPECEIKAELLYQFYYNELMAVDNQLKVNQS